MNRKKYAVVWIAAAVIFLAVLAVILVVELGKKEDKSVIGFPQDAIEASMKLSKAGYTVSVEDSMQMLASLANEASMMYEIAFSGQLVSYITASDAETGELQAEIFYFEYNADATRLYEKMAQDWNFSKEEGELRVKDKTVYMGYSKALDALED